MSTTTTPATPATPTIAHTVLRAQGFSCPSCVGKIEKRLGRLPGVTAVKVGFASARIEVDHDPALTPVETLVAEVGRVGYHATVAD